jgi:hypothetical protein
MGLEFVQQLVLFITDYYGESGVGLNDLHDLSAS